MTTKEELDLLSREHELWNADVESWRKSDEEFTLRQQQELHEHMQNHRARHKELIDSSDARIKKWEELTAKQEQESKKLKIKRQNKRTSDAYIKSHSCYGIA